jgi:ribosomal protein L7/L12
MRESDTDVITATKLETFSVPDLVSLILEMQKHLNTDTRVISVATPANTSHKIHLIKAIYAATDCELQEVKNFVEGNGFLLVTDREHRVIECIYTMLDGTIAVAQSDASL